MNTTRPVPRWFNLRRLGLLSWLLALLLVLPYMGSGTELVRMRHALSLAADVQPGAALDWQPPALPAHYRSDEVPPDPYFVTLAQQLKLAELPDDWARGLAISAHLLGSAPVLSGGAVQHDLQHTYRAIVERGDGYCGDFVRVYAALAGAAGMTVRPWAFSFDGYGGHGHIWIELWNRQQQRWQLLDIFNNYFYVDRSASGDNQPLSAQQLRAALVAGSTTLALRPLHAAARPGFVIEAKAWDYVRRGLDQWYLHWGNNVFEQDSAWPVKAFAGVSRTAQGLAAQIVGVAPPVRLLATPGNAPQRAALRALHGRLYAATLLLFVGTGLLLGPMLSRARRVRPLAPAHAAPSLQPDATQPWLTDAANTAAWPRVCLVGPLPPPSGGMANQCEQLHRLLQAEGAAVSLVRTNAPVWPAFLAPVPVLRAVLRLLPYLGRLWAHIGRADVVHLLANSGWAWHLVSAPALVMARLRGVPVIVNYRGGQADTFLASQPPFVHQLLAGAALRVVPSRFLLRVFAQHGLQADVVPNIIDLARFNATPRLDVASAAPRPDVASAAPRRGAGQAPHLIVTRNLEPIYDIPTVLRAFALVRRQRPGATLTVAGSGPELQALQALSAELGLGDAVRFSGRVDNRDIAALVASADLVLNASTVDNMPISILEALASGVPVVSTAAGGIPDLVEHGRTAWLVPVGDADALAAGALRLLDDAVLNDNLRRHGLAEVARYAWPAVREQWRGAYWRAVQVRVPLPTSAGREPGLPR